MISDNMWQSVVITNISTPRARACTSSSKVVRRISLLSPALLLRRLKSAAQTEEKAAQAPAAARSQDTRLKRPVSVHISCSDRDLAAYTTVY